MLACFGLDSLLPCPSRQQDLLRERVVVGDEFRWASGDGVGASLRYVGGVDVSFAKDDPSIACGALVVVDLLRRAQCGESEGAPGVVHEVYDVVRLTVPYVPGFLAFREVSPRPPSSLSSLSTQSPGALFSGFFLETIFRMFSLNDREDMLRSHFP